MKLRLANPQDAPALAALHADSFDRPWSAQDIAAVLGDANGFAILAEEEDAPLGFALLFGGADRDVLIVATRADRRRRGVGRAVLQAAATEAQRRGSEALLLEVAEENDAARALYAALGFVEIGRRRNYYSRPNGAASDARVLRLALQPAHGHEAPARAYVAAEGARPMDRLEKLCAEKGMRMTDQRRVIARVLSVSKDHPDVEELHRRAVAIDPKISIATVYRTVRLFEEAGILTRHDFMDGRSRYEEAREEHHDHLIDMKSGEVVEFVSEEIEKLQEEIARKLGYELVGHKLELYGVPIKKG